MQITTMTTTTMATSTAGKKGLWSILDEADAHEAFKVASIKWI